MIIWDFSESSEHTDGRNTFGYWFCGNFMLSFVTILHIQYGFKAEEELPDSKEKCRS